MRMLWPRLRYYIYWLSQAVSVCAFIALVWIFETAQRQPDALHAHEMHIKSAKRYVTAERHKFFNNAEVALFVSSALIIGLTIGQLRRDRKQQKSNQQGRVQ